MTDNNIDSAQRFGAEEQQRLADAQRQANAGGDKCDIIVVLSPTSKSDDVQSLDSQGNLQSFNFTGVKSHDRLVQLLSHVSEPLRGANTAYDILLPKNGVPAEISLMETFDNNYSARVVRYSVNLTVSEMRNRLSRALFDVVGQGNLDDVVAKAGIFALYLIENKQAVNVLQEIERQFADMRGTQSYRSVADLSDEELEQSLIDFRRLPGANNCVLIEGVKRAFLIQNAQGQLVTFSNSAIGESNVAPQNKAPAVEAVDLEDEQFDDEEISGRAILGYNADELTQDQKIEALTAAGYDLTDWEEEAINETFLAEQEVYLSENGDGESDSDDEAEEGDDEEEADVENGEDEAGPTAVAIFADLLEEAQYDRQNLKRVIIILGGKCLQSDTEETLTAKILADIAERELDETGLVELLEETLIPSMITRNADVSAFSDWLDAEDVVDEDDEGEEEEEADDEQSEDEDEDASDLDDEGDDEEDDTSMDFVDALDAFDHDGSALTHDQRVAAIVALGSDVTGLNTIQVMKLFRSLQAENGLNTFEPVVEETESEDEETEVASILRAADRADLVTILDLLGVDYNDDDTDEDLIVRIEQSGETQEEADALHNAALTYGLNSDGIDGLTFDDLLAAFLLAYFSDSEGTDVDGEEEEDEPDFEESLSDQIIEAAGEPNANPLNLSIDSDDQKFLIEGERTPAGQLMSVDMPQSLLINFTLTDRATFEESKELEDIEGVNFRFPFVNPKSDEKARGSLYQPAATLIEIMEQSATPRFLVDRNQFDVQAFSNQLNEMFESQLTAELYQGLLEDGEDPREVGVKVGDFVDDEMLEDSDIDPDYWKNFAGDDLAMYTFINGHVGARPVTLEERNSVLCLGVLNVALPGVWAISGKQMPKMINNAINAVKSMLAANTKINVYVGFTLSSGSLIVDDTLANVVTHLRTNYDELFTYSSADCALFADNEDVLEIAASLDNVDRLPLEVLSSGYADKTFENGGDLTILIPCFEAEAIDADDADEDEDEE